MKVFSLFCLVLPLFSFALSPLKERLEQTNPGDYIVLKANKTVTLLCTRKQTPHSLILEEITVPFSQIPRETHWADWIKQNAPGHTSWSMLEVDLSTHEILECFSFSLSRWVKLGEQESLISSLLNLSLDKVPPQNQRKIGPPPMDGEPDLRKSWVPPFFFEGQKIPSPRFEVYKGTWPKDQSDLSNQTLFFYFDQEKKLPLPFWIQIETSHAALSIQILDSGKNLPSIHKHLPRRAPEFVGLARKVEEKLLLNLKSPKYYKHFELYAIDVTEKQKKILPITYSMIEGKEEWKTLYIDLAHLDEHLQPNHQYRWLLIPEGYINAYTETTKPFTW